MADMLTQAGSRAAAPIAVQQFGGFRASPASSQGQGADVQMSPQGARQGLRMQQMSQMPDLRSFAMSKLQAGMSIDDIAKFTAVASALTGQADPFNTDTQESATTGGSTKLTELQRKFYGAADEAQNALGLLESGEAKTGKLNAMFSPIARFTGTQSDGQTDYNARIGMARTAARNAMLGANMTDKELASLSQFIPEYTDEPAIAKQKLATFVSAMQNMASRTGEESLYDNYGQEATYGQY